MSENTKTRNTPIVLNAPIVKICGDLRFRIKEAGTWVDERDGLTKPSPRNMTLQGIGTGLPMKVSANALAELYFFIRDDPTVQSIIQQRILEEVGPQKHF